MKNKERINSVAAFSSLRDFSGLCVCISITMTQLRCYYSLMDSTFPGRVHLSFFKSLSLNCDFCDLYDEEMIFFLNHLNHTNQVNHSSNKNTPLPLSRGELRIFFNPDRDYILHYKYSIPGGLLSLQCFSHRMTGKTQRVYCKELEL